MKKTMTKTSSQQRNKSVKSFSFKLSPIALSALLCLGGALTLSNTAQAQVVPCNTGNTVSGGADVTINADCGPLTLDGAGDVSINPGVTVGGRLALP